jgi:tRNA A37 threonylcarbamoyltransferase TsaD
VPLRVPPLALGTDNAAMMAAVASSRLLASRRDALEWDTLPNWKLT